MFDNECHNDYEKSKWDNVTFYECLELTNPSIANDAHASFTKAAMTISRLKEAIQDDDDMNAHKHELMDIFENYETYGKIVKNYSSCLRFLLRNLYGFDKVFSSGDEILNFLQEGNRKLGHELDVLNHAINAADGTEEQNESVIELAMYMQKALEKKQESIINAGQRAIIELTHREERISINPSVISLLPPDNE